MITGLKDREEKNEFKVGIIPLICYLFQLQDIQTRFNEFQLGIEAGSERFTRVDNMATALVEAKNPQSTVVVQRQEDLRNKWEELLNAVDTRTDKLHGAAEIHR